MTAVAVPPLVGRQDPTFLWVPPHADSLGDVVIDLAGSCGLVLDPWQQQLVRYTCAVDPADAWLCFEAGVVVSRQNGKGAYLAALELAWLFAFGDPLIIHSSHRFKTSREHFLKMQTLINGHDAFRRRVKAMRQGKGDEEIELTNGQRLMFLSRTGGAGRGFTANKVVLDEAMYLDSTMMEAALPTLATIPNAQVIYTGSAGMKHSTQLGLVRKRGLAGDDPALLYAEWAAEKAIYDEHGTLVAGDDPADEATWAKTNPGLGVRITSTYIRREMAALGGPNSPSFGQERLGLGDWPEDDQSWEVIGKDEWDADGDPSSVIPDRAAIALAIDADSDRAMGTIAVCGARGDARRHVEVIERHRGTGWIFGATTGRDDPTRPLSDYEQAIVARMVDFKARYRVRGVAILKTSTAASLIAALVKAGLPVYSPSELEYAQACGQFYEAVVADMVRHIGQPSLTNAVGGARKRTNVEGGWRWSRDSPVDAAPLAAVTLARWAYETYAVIPRSRVF